MRLDAWIMFGLWVIVVIGLIGTILKQDREKMEMEARHAAELAGLRGEHQMELAKVAARYFLELRTKEERHEEAAAAMKKEMDRLRLDNKALREVLRTMEEKQRRAAS